eukprot:gene13319-28217_t
MTSPYAMKKFTDNRGSLMAINFPELPFVCRRIFLVTDVPEGCIRGHHAHYITDQMLHCISGRIQIIEDNVHKREIIVLSQGQSHYHRAMTWAEISFLDQGSVLLSACSTDFDPLDYMGDYEVYKNLVLKTEIEKKKNALARIEPVPLINLKANYESIRIEVNHAIQKVLDSAYYINGPAVATFEKEWATFLGTSHCVGVSNGTDALVLALQALGISRNDEVITQGNAYIADALTIDSIGATMKLVDQDETFQLDLNLLEKAITPATKCIIVVHMYGSCCNMDRLISICQSHNISLIEDCAHAHGATWNGKRLGSYGDIACWSFYPGKNLGAYGDGGACTTNNQTLADDLRLLKNYGSNRKYYNHKKGLNHRLDTIHATILSTKLKYLEKWNSRRRDIASQYYIGLEGVGDISFPIILSECVPVYHQFVIITAMRDQLLAYLNIGCKIESIMHYPVPIHQQEAFLNYSHVAPEIPLSDTYCHKILSLPMCPMMSDEQILRVIYCIKTFFDINDKNQDRADSNSSNNNSNNKKSTLQSFTITTATNNTTTTIENTTVDNVMINTPRILSNSIRNIFMGKGVTIVQPVNMYDCTLHDDVFIGPFVEVQGEVSIGARSRIQSHSFICERVDIGEDCFIGHGVMFVNDKMK